MAATTELRKRAKHAPKPPSVRLRRADTGGPGIRRRRAGRGFVYLDPDGEKVKGGLIVARKMTSRECHKKYG